MGDPLNPWPQGYQNMFLKGGASSVAYYYSNRKTLLLQSAFGFLGRERIGVAAQDREKWCSSFTNEGNGTSIHCDLQLSSRYSGQH